MTGGKKKSFTGKIRAKRPKNERRNVVDVVLEEIGGPALTERAVTDKHD